MFTGIVDSDSEMFYSFMDKLYIKTVKSNRYYYIKYRDFFNGKIIREYIGAFTENNEQLYFYYREFEAKRKIKIIKQISERTYDSTILPELIMKSMDFIRFLYHEELSQYSPSELEKMQENVYTKYVQGTTAIEGNTYDLRETHLTLNEGLTVTGKDKREFYEIDNYDKWRNYLRTIKNPKIETKEFIRKIHEYILKNIEDGQAGRFRRIQVGISGSEWIPSPPVAIEHDLEELFTWFQENQSKLYPIELIARFHSRFEEIHPFIDGNGRVGREIMRLQLNKYHFPPIFINNKHREKYLQSLTEANNQNYKPIIVFIYNLIIQESTELLDVARKEISKSIDLFNQKYDELSSIDNTKSIDEIDDDEIPKVNEILENLNIISELETEYLDIFSNTLLEFSELMDIDIEDVELDDLDFSRAK